MAREQSEGFDHTRYRDEVTERWGKEAYERGDAWWRSLSDAERRSFGEEQLEIARAFGEAKAAGLAADGEEAQSLARRLYDWVAVGWQGRKPTAEAFVGLGEMYVADPRFTENYDRHGSGTAVFVRDAMKAYAERNLR